MADRPSPPSLARAGRGQTTHDFAFGISIFLVATMFVVTFVPNVTTPYTTGITEVEQEHAQGATRVLMVNLSTTGESTALNVTRTDAFFARSWGEPELERRLGLPDTAGVNVTLREPSVDGVTLESAGRHYAVGDDYRSQSAATAVRVVTYGGEPYRLEVRVW